MKWLQYFRLKAIAILVRFFGTWMMSGAVKRDLLHERDTKPQRIQIPSRDPGRSIKCLLYAPPDSKKTKKEKTPVLVNWHGSGFVVPGLGMDHAYCARVAREAGIAVLDADYRKGPETCYPGPLEDAEDVLRWIVRQPEEFDVSRVAVSGFSAGGTLALASATSLRQSLPSGMNIPIVVAVYPLTDFTFGPVERRIDKPIDPVPHSMLSVFSECYAPDPAIRTDPRVSPGRADPASFPDTVVIIAASGDTLSPEAEILAAQLKNDGKRRVVSLTLEDAGHGFDKGPVRGSKKWEQREKAYSLIVRTIRESFHL